ncbi:MATE family efflux transporter [Synergistaceae bacterium OttesenSCG-928-I11]|nr:MATE family efflux transporter [Synergistaceae bacterium OttesenSCG-928-I11]
MNDNTKKSLRKKFFAYAVPSVVAMWVFSFYSMVDGFFVSLGNGPLALASVNIAMPFVNFLFGLSILCSAGASTVISIYLGKGKHKEAVDAFMTNLVTLGIFSLILSALCLLFIDDLARFLGATPNLFGQVKDYLRIVSYFVVFFVTTYYFEVTVRADGYPKLAAISVGVAALTNIVLDYIFVLRFGWGVAGAAWATGIAQCLSAAILAVHFFSRRTQLGFHAFTYRLGHVARSIRLGVGDSVTEFSVGIVIFLFNKRILQVIGETGVVSYTVMAYVTTLVVMTMSGISQGMQPLVAYSHGRGDRTSCGYLLKLALKTAAFCSIGWFLIMEALPGAFVSIFINGATETKLYSDTVSAFRIYSISYLFIGVNVVLATYFSTVEQPVYGIALSISRGVLVIGVALFAMSSLMGATGIWLTPTVSEIACVGIAAAAFYFMQQGKEKSAAATNPA